MPDDDRELPKADDLGEGPETRMENYPAKSPPPKDGPTGGSPGFPKPKEADAVGDNDTEELAEEMDGEDLRRREQNHQRRIDESKPPNPA